MKVEKNPGWDWKVIYQSYDDPKDIMYIFGQMSIEDALKEAHYSLRGFNSESEQDYTILGVYRI
jgi:hypothetical protein